MACVCILTYPYHGLILKAAAAHACVACVVSAQSKAMSDLMGFWCMTERHSKSATCVHVPKADPGDTTLSEITADIEGSHMPRCTCG